MIEFHQWPYHLFPSSEDYCHQTTTPNDPEYFMNTFINKKYTFV